MDETLGPVATITMERPHLYIRPHVGTLPELKGLLGAKWINGRKAWQAPAALWALTAAREALPEAEVANSALELYQPLTVDPGVLDRHPMAAKLYDYQRETALRLLGHPRGQLVVLSPGLGKTALSIVAADLDIPMDERILVVAPASLLRTWKREIEFWSIDPSVTIAHGSEPDAAARWTLTTYDMLVPTRMHKGQVRKRAAAAWFHFKWPLAILDESVLIKSRSANRFKALSKMRAYLGKTWLLSGSPTTRHVDDLWGQLHVLWPRAFNSYWRFSNRYGVVDDGVWAKTVTGSRSDRDVKADNADLMIVVNQEDVLELPEYLFATVDCGMTGPQQRAYNDMLNDFVAVLDGKELSAAAKIAQLMRLQQIVSGLGDLDSDESGKHDAFMETFDKYELPAIVWTHWKANAKQLTERLRKARYKVVHVHGDLGQQERDDLIQGFKAGKHEILVLSLAVGKFGHTLINAKTVHYIDKTWNADDYFQSLRRVRRIGLGHRPVIVTYRAPGTVDDVVELNLEGKLGGIAKVTNSRLKELLMGLGRSNG